MTWFANRAAPPPPAPLPRRPVRRPLKWKGENGNDRAALRCLAGSRVPHSRIRRYCQASSVRHRTHYDKAPAELSTLACAAIIYRKQLDGSPLLPRCNRKTLYPPQPGPRRRFPASQFPGCGCRPASCVVFLGRHAGGSPGRTICAEFLDCAKRIPQKFSRWFPGMSSAHPSDPFHPKFGSVSVAWNQPALSVW